MAAMDGGVSRNVAVLIGCVVICVAAAATWGITMLVMRVRSGQRLTLAPDGIQVKTGITMRRFRYEQVRRVEPEFGGPEANHPGTRITFTRGRVASIPSQLVAFGELEAVLRSIIVPADRDNSGLRIAQSRRDRVAFWVAITLSIALVIGVIILSFFWFDPQTVMVIVGASGLLLTVTLSKHAQGSGFIVKQR